LKIKKGIILGGGKGTRLFPLTRTLNKHLFPIYNKPMIYFPIANLMEAGIRDILLIANPNEEKLFYNLLKNGEHLGISIQYIIQPEPRGLPQAFILGEEFINSDPVCLNLGDHILFGVGLDKILSKVCNNFSKTTLFIVKTDSPKEYGVVDFDKNGQIIDIQEKPIKPKSNFIVTGLYFYDSDVVEYSKSLKFSKRNELEISDLNNIYLSKKKLNTVKLNSNINWLDAGSSKRILDISNFIYYLETEKKLFFACLENIALKKGFITENQYYEQIDRNKGSEYAEIMKMMVS